MTKPDRVLIVSDHRTSRQKLTSFLSDEFMTDTVSSVEDLKQLEWAHDTAVLILALSVTPPSLLSVLLDIRKTPFFGEILVCQSRHTATHDVISELSQAVSCGVSDIIELPPSKAELLLAVGKSVTRYKHQASQTRHPTSGIHPDVVPLSVTLLASHLLSNPTIDPHSIPAFLPFPLTNIATLKYELDGILESLSARYKDLSLLVIEDHPDIRHLLTAYLTQFFTVTSAKNTPSAIETIHSVSTLDVVLLDIELDGKTGYTLLPDILSHHPKSKTIMLTSYADFDLIVKTVQEGACHYLLKETDPTVVVSTIQRVYLESLISQIISKYSTF